MVDPVNGGPLPPHTAIPGDIVGLPDYERHAAAHMPAASLRHVQSGAGAETTLAANRAQFDRYRLKPSAMADMHGASTEVELFGQRHAAPILLAPLAYHKIAHPDGELATMAAATALDTTMVVSTLSSVPLEHIADQARAIAREMRMAAPPLWFQLYLQPDRAHSLELVRRAERAGYGVLVLTVDAGVKRAGFTLPPGVDAANLRGMPSPVQETSAIGGKLLFGTPLLDTVPTWADLEWLRSVTVLPIVVKGLLSASDARLAVERGADGVIVSNHGGRVLDGLAVPLEVLPGIVEAVAGKAPVLMDGGVRYGTAVLKALALGAAAVLVGRPQIHALAVAGMPGVAHALHMLRTELELAMAQVGCPTLDAVRHAELLTA
jgi:4-hydroxymandelate oxidase